MRWKIGTLYGLVQVGIDETHKPVCELAKVGEAHFRTLPWKPNHYDVAGNEFDRVSRTWFTKKQPDELANVKVIELGNYTWTVEHVAHFSDGAAVVVWRAKPIGATGATGATGSTGTGQNDGTSIRNVR